MIYCRPNKALLLNVLLQNFMLACIFRTLCKPSSTSRGVFWSALIFRGTGGVYGISSGNSEPALIRKNWKLRILKRLPFQIEFF